MRWVLALAAALFGSGLPAYELRELQVLRDGQHYTLNLDADLRASPAAVYGWLADLPAMAQLNPRLRLLELSPADAQGRQRVLSVGELCVLSLCQSLRHGQTVQFFPTSRGGRIVAQTLPPPVSDFASGETLWTVEPSGEGSRLRIEARSEPAFWLPPWIGPRLLERRLREETLLTVERLELLAGGDSP